MNPASNPTPREEWEARVVALLLGELPDAEAAVVRQQLAQDPELAQLYKDIELTLPLVREAVTPAPGGASTPTEPLRMSSPRRETLLNHFKVVALPPRAASARRPLAWLWPMTLAASLVALLGFWGSDSAWFAGGARSGAPLAFLPGVSLDTSLQSLKEEAPQEAPRKMVGASDVQFRARIKTEDSLALGVQVEKTPAREIRDEQEATRRYKARTLAAGRPSEPAKQYGLAANVPATPPPASAAPASGPIAPAGGVVNSTLGYEAPSPAKVEAVTALSAANTQVQFNAPIAPVENPSMPAVAPSPEPQADKAGTGLARLSDEKESLRRRSEAQATGDAGNKRQVARYQYQVAGKSESASTGAATKAKESAKESVVRELLETAAPAPVTSGEAVPQRANRDTLDSVSAAAKVPRLAKADPAATLSTPAADNVLGDAPTLGKLFRGASAKPGADAGGLANELNQATRFDADVERFGSRVVTNSAGAGGSGFSGGGGFGGMAGGRGGVQARFGEKKDTTAVLSEGLDDFYAKAAVAETEAKNHWNFSGQADGAVPVTAPLGNALPPGAERNREVADGKTVAGIMGGFQVQQSAKLEEARKPVSPSNGRQEKWVERSSRDQEQVLSLARTLDRGAVARSEGQSAAAAGNSALFFSDFDASTIVAEQLTEQRAETLAKSRGWAVLNGVEQNGDASKGVSADHLGRVSQREAGVAPGSEARQIAAVELKDLAAAVAPPAATPPQQPSAGADDRSEYRRVPPPVPQPEVSTKENAFSTFSLNISDVSFKLAEASLQNGTLPDPGSIRTEEFLNSFEYRDPEPAAGRAVGFSYDEARYPFAHNRDVLRFSVKTAAKGREAGRPLNLVLLLDHSGSMERSDRVQIIQECLRVLTGQLKAQDKLSIVTFARTAQLRFDGMSGTAAAQAADQVGEFTPEGGTNLEGALDLAYQTARRHFLSGGVNRVVLLTDGAANLGEVEPEQLKRKVEEQRRQGIALDGFGIGWEGYADDVLEVLTRHGDGRYGFINTVEEAAQGFAAQLAGALQVAAADVKVQVEFNPARVTTYRQLGYAKHQLTKEQFRDNTVDAAEIGAAETGTALYLAEINPRGQGDLGVVRVRYKVPGTEEYREEEWTVPYRPGVPALDQAAPSLRLAATAGAFAEWLAASPFAAEVTPDALLQLLQSVPAQYGADTRPPRLERMIRQAKSISGK